jgi:hypothetical protein
LLPLCVDSFMSRRLLSSLLLLSSLSFGACAPSMQRAHDAGPGHVVEQPKPAPRIDRARLRAALAERRALSYQRFLAYREARVYPKNTYNTGAQHVWLDASGHLCAAATIISGDWGRDATEAVADEDNFLALADVRTGPLADWILTSGLAKHEIVAIQVPPMYPEPPMPDAPVVVDPEAAENERLYAMYVDVERQITGMWDENLDEATDALMARPDLARALLDGVAAGPGRVATRAPVASGGASGFAQPPPA